MYSEKFSKLYKESGWELFPDVFSDYFLKYFKKKKIQINSNLDLACGTGFLCNKLSQLGIKSTGVDISSYMINIAKTSYPTGEFVIDDINTLRLNKTFDLVTCTCDSLNHLESLTSLHNAINTAHKHLKEDGYFVFDIINTRKIKTNTDFTFQTDNATITYKFSIKNNKLLNTDIEIETDKTTHTERIVELIINKKDIIDILSEIGFKVILCKNKIKNQEFGLTSKLFFICKKVNKKNLEENEDE